MTCNLCGRSEPTVRFQANPRNTGGKKHQCTECNETKRLALVATRLAAGLCGGCGNVREDLSKKRCASCLKKNTDNQHRIRSEARDAGRCLKCFKSLATCGVVCEPCWWVALASRLTGGRGRVGELKRLMAGQEYRCALTGEQIRPGGYVSLDHVPPKSVGGTDEIGNLRFTTFEANQAKNNLTDEQFFLLCRQVLERQGYHVVQDEADSGLDGMVLQ